MTAAYDIKQLKDYSLFPIMVQENMRYRDLDTNGHMNNAVFATYFELARGRARHACPCHACAGKGRHQHDRGCGVAFAFSA